MQNEPKPIPENPDVLKGYTTPIFDCEYCGEEKAERPTVVGPEANRHPVCEACRVSYCEKCPECGLEMHQDYGSEIQRVLSATYENDPSVGMVGVYVDAEEVWVCDQCIPTVKRANRAKCDEAEA